MKKLATSEYDEDYVGFENLSSRKKAKRIIIALAVVLLLVFVICLIFIVLFALEKSKVHEQAAQELPPQPQICPSKKCLFAAVGKFTCIKVANQLFLFGASSGSHMSFFIMQRQLRNQKKTN